MTNAIILRAKKLDNKFWRLYMSTKVCKFGGTSMANSSNINDIAAIINSDAERKYVVVSAPGKDLAMTEKSLICFMLAITRLN